MIAHLQGKLVEKNPTEVIIDCNGVGYHVNISLHTFSLLPNSDAIKLFTYLQIKEDSHTLFGFVEKSEREIFKMLLSVSGIGASIARTMLSSLEPKQIIQAIASATGEKPGWRLEGNVQEMARGLCGIAFGRGFRAGISQTF